MRIVRQGKIRDEEVYGSGILNRVIVSVSCLVDGGHSPYLASSYPQHTSECIF